MMKIITLSLFCLLPAYIPLPKEANAIKKDGAGWIRDGHYVSYHSNGKKKAEGYFEHNQRSGKWEVWDSTGQKRMERFYDSPYDFRIIAEYGAMGTALDGTKIVKYPSKTNSDGYRDYYKLEQENILYAKRLWRYLEPGGVNDHLFMEHGLYEVMCKAIFETQDLTAYVPNSDEFIKDMPFEMVKSRFGDAVADPKKTNIVGYRIKSDFFYDKQSKVSEERIIGICPVAKLNMASQATTDLFWIYMPELRRHLAARKLVVKTAPGYITSLDDIFYFGYYNSTIIKVSNNKNQSLKDYCTTPEALDKEQRRIAKEIIEAEHDLWMEFTSGN